MCAYSIFKYISADKTCIFKSKLKKQNKHVIIIGGFGFPQMSHGSVGSGFGALSVARGLQGPQVSRRRGAYSKQRCKSVHAKP